MSALKHVTSEGFDADVLRSEIPVVVDFHATWCMPCKLLGPALEKLADEYPGRLRIVKVDVDQEPELAGRYDIHGVPALLFFHRGTVVDSAVGLLPLPTLRAKLDRHAAARSPTAVV